MFLRVADILPKQDLLFIGYTAWRRTVGQRHEISVLYRSRTGTPLKDESCLWTIPQKKFIKSCLPVESYKTLLQMATRLR